MKIVNLIILDIRNGVIAVWYRGLFAGGIFFLLNFAFFKYTNHIEGLLEPLTLGDYYANVFIGVKWAVFQLDRPIALPFNWLLVTFLILFFTLGYPSKDLGTIGKHLLVLFGDRFRWWIAKCIWVLFVEILYFFTWLIVTILWIMMTQGAFELSLSSTALASTGLESQMMIQQPWAIVKFIAVTFITVLSLCLLQMFFSLYLQPVFTFIISLSIQLLSIFIASPILLGNYLMIVRSSIFVPDGYDWLAGVFISIGIIIVIVLFGGWYFKRMDLINKEN